MVLPGYIADYCRKTLLMMIQGFEGVDFLLSPLCTISYIYV